MDIFLFYPHIPNRVQTHIAHLRQVPEQKRPVHKHFPNQMVHCPLQPPVHETGQCKAEIPQSLVQLRRACWGHRTSALNNPTILHTRRLLPSKAGHGADPSPGPSRC